MSFTIHGLCVVESCTGSQAARARKDRSKNNEYNLNIPRYVDSSEKPESYDIYSNIFGGIPKKEVEELSNYWVAFPSLKDELFAITNAHSLELKVDDVESAILNNNDVKTYSSNFNAAFRDFYAYLRNELIAGLDSLDSVREETKISNNIFDRLNAIPLIDKYDSYQILDDEWSKIAVDLEIISTEGKSSITKVDPNMVIKKKNDKEVEVQEGYIGHVIPFELVQSEYFNDELEEIKNKENRIDEINSRISELFEEVSEDDKEDDCIDNEKGEFVAKQISQRAKELKRQKNADRTEFDEIVLEVAKLQEETKALNKSVKELKAALLDKTKDKLEGLSLDEAMTLLEHKWIRPIVDSIMTLPQLVIKQLVSIVKKLSKKYSDTLINLDEEIEKVESELSSMIDDLNGDEFDMKGLVEFKKLLGGEN